MIDLDANATTQLLPEVLDAMLPWLREGYANPSGSYAAAKAARKAIEQARGHVAELIGAEPEEIVFTGGGTESVNTALQSLNALAGPGAAYVSAIEHSAVLRCVENLPRETQLASVDAGGRLDIDAFAAHLENTAFISIMMANNETGIIQPLREATEIAHARGLPVHSDAVQAAGKIPLNVRETEVDLLSISAHKFHGPKGMGALYIRQGLKFKPLLWGGGQEAGRRSGTQNTAGIVGMGAAAVCAMQYLTQSPQMPMRTLRDTFETGILAELSGVTVNGDLAHRLPNTSHLSFDGCDAAGLLILLDESGIACSAGSACMTGKQRPSHVQLAMGIPELRAKSSLRISFSRLSTMEHTLEAISAIIKAVKKLRRIQGSSIGPVVVYSP